jgi:hypothetical protein
LEAADAFWHLTNFLAPALVVSAFATLLAKAVWRRQLAPGRGWRLWGWAAAASAAVSVAGMVVFGHDGQIATYAAMVAACAIALWWFGFGSGGKP